MDTKVYLLQNTRDKCIYDVAQKRKDGSWIVWGFVHEAFLHDSGLMEQLSGTKYPERVIVKLVLSDA